MQVAVRFDNSGKLANGAVLDRGDVAQPDQSGAHDKDWGHEVCLGKKFAVILAELSPALPQKRA